MMNEYFDSDFNISCVMRVLLTSEYFKSDAAFYSRVKAPVESVVGTARLAGSYNEPTLNVHSLWSQATFMGQGLLSPPTVEGWHEGTEWINSGALVGRINFATEHLGDICKPGVKAMADRVVAAHNTDFSSEQFVDDCLDEMGGIDVSFETRKNLTFMALRGISSSSSDMTVDEQMRNTAVEVFRIIASTREFQRV